MKKLYFKEKFFKITDHYPILDENGREAYYLDQDFTFLGYESKVSDLNAKTILKISRQLLTFLPRYTVSMGDGRSMIVQKKFEFFRHRVDVSLDDDALYLEGDIFHLNFTVTNKNGQMVGAVNKKFFALTDTYELIVYDEAYIEELIGLVICLNNMIDLEEAANSGS
ncbi:LURP-one-related family protein [Anaerococcus sp. Marseille-Q7828]|uniref:LURP-one-related/scramblase family protein n=1 Tax=Anaerococcus sp. Marseille-Q7828 TaxID=3036300 RepID=UPI0024ACD247|nr:LURP-one-related family protein [Anaerococcus sp. Marseille-Q7828]